MKYTVYIKGGLKPERFWDRKIPETEEEKEILIKEGYIEANQNTIFSRDLIKETYKKIHFDDMLECL